VGMVIDALFVTLAPATAGITEVLKWLPWAVIVALDILEITNLVQPEEELPTSLRFILFGADVLGLVFTAPMAAPIRNFVKGLVGKSATEIAAIFKSNPQMAGTLKKMLPAFEKVPSFFEKASKYLKDSKIGSLFAQAFSRLGEVIKTATTEISKFLGTTAGKTASTVTSTTGIIYGAEKGAQAYSDYKQSKEEEELIQSVQQADLSNFEF